MYAFSDWVISLFEKNGIVLKHNRSTYVYGLDIFLYTILSTVGLLLIGYVLHHFYESVFFFTQTKPMAVDFMPVLIQNAF